MRKILVLLFVTLCSVLFYTGCKPEPTWKNKDNTVRVRLPSDVKSLNPFLYRTAYEATSLNLVFQYLMDFDPATLQLSPQLVTAAPVVADITEGEYAGGQTFTFEIHDEAVWDDGEAVDAFDVLFSLKVLFNPKLPTQRLAAYLDFIRDVVIEPNNPKKFTVFTNRKYFLAETAVSNITVIPEHIYDADGLMKTFALKDLTNPTKVGELVNEPYLQQYADLFMSPEFSRDVVSGSGPYQLSEWVDGQRIVLSKKKNWWGEKLAKKFPMLAAYPDTITILPIPDQTAAITALKDESIDVGLELDPAQFKELQSNQFVNEIYNLSTPPRYVFFYVAMNNKNPKLSDKRVRRALAHLLDMDAIIRDLYDGFGERVVGPFLPDKPYYHKGLKLIQMNLDSSRALLAAAGWTDSNGNGTVDKLIDGQLVEMKLQYLQTPGSAFQDNFTEVFKVNAAKTGIELEKVQVEANVLGERLRNRDYEVANRGAGSGPWLDDPKQLFHTDSDNPGGTNYARFGNTESDALIDGIRDAKDEKTRNELYLKFQEIVYDEQPLIFQFAPLDKLAVHKRFEATITRKTPGVSLQMLKLK